MSAWSFGDEPRGLECIHLGAFEVRPGDCVRLCPRRRADILDLALQGKLAVVESIVEDFEGRVFLAVTLEDDPGRDLGQLHQVGHRFFFERDEVQPLGADEANLP